ncbi:hypothetical protein A3B45_00520 [Candidatus Daviesbacteria bacterium RIFCSPLOWO2_01_FULL_39_12]|uniref:Uncharacterized protein n=1 Tax=Candidatus Daviesbacteria bacterium RIFCSPLOWO2_01_FULL_39_12 TaxID=1797785 RepID=A0A1F5KP78_9BACT|nr:MAG: hypothetical protein A3D79_02335 [Candidatus Daviesbacteria bacterium RIFCSPHIGHO2_02_FULL_39_8]OGE42718.1 MAG: hypothetical protein A3B45_00520 [Candidatus Daviesbacteria bacterium RIFCSPLOWO2_01_FULL_39_12]
MPALIEAARNNLQSRAQAEEAARARSREVSAIHQLYRDMFSDCMSILRGTNDPAPFYREVPVLREFENLLVKSWGSERRVDRTWEDNAGQPVTVVLDGWPLHRNDAYAHLKVEGLPDRLSIYRDPNAKDVKGYIEHKTEKGWEYKDEKAVTLEEVQQWRELVGFLKGQQETQ